MIPVLKHLMYGEAQAVCYGHGLCFSLERGCQKGLGKVDWAAPLPQLVEIQSPPQPPPDGGGLFVFQPLTKVNFRPA